MSDTVSDTTVSSDTVPSDTAPPFLVIGAGRGGTSVLAAALAGHSRLVVAMELFGLSHLLGMDLAQGGDTDIFSTRTRAFREGCLAEVRRHPDRIWGNKITTEHLFGLEDHNAANPPYADMIDRFFRDVVPEFRIIFIIRDGRACVASKVRRTGQSWEQAAFRWHYAVQVLAAVRRLDRPVCEIRFEDLVAEPVPALEAACRCLGVAFEPAMLAQTQSSAMLPEYRRPGFEADRAAVPEVPPHVAAFLRPALDFCGYA